MVAPDGKEDKKPKNVTKMRNVLRDPSGAIKHVLYTIHEGVYYWLTKEGQEKMYEFGRENLVEYYSGDAEDELASALDDMELVVSGEMTKEYLMLRIARSTGLINWQEDVLETNGNPQ